MLKSNLSERVQAKLRLKRYTHVTHLINLVLYIINFQMWFVGLLLTSSYLSFGLLGNRKLVKIMETVAAVCALISLLIFFLTLYFKSQLEKESTNKDKLEQEKTLFEEQIKKVSVVNKQGDDNSGEEENQILKSLKEELDYVECLITKQDNPGSYKNQRRLDNFLLALNSSGLIILSIMQVVAAVDMWLGLGVENAHKSLGLAFSMQNIFDTLGLSLLFLSLLIKTGCNIAQSNNRKQEKLQVKDWTKMGVPIVALGLILTGKIMMGLESNLINIPINDGAGSFPLALLLRIIGLSISLLSLIFIDVRGDLEKTTVYDPLVTAANIGVIASA